MPHSQLDQQPDEAARSQLERRFRSVVDVDRGPSGISVPGAEALCARDGAVTGPPAAFLVGREFAHLHPLPDSSLHMALPETDAQRAIDAGWAELHPLSGSPDLSAVVVMVYAPRDEAEVDVVMLLLERSRRFATTPV